MNPEEQLCPNRRCSASGKVGADNIVIHSKEERRYKCKCCGKTFSETKDTAFYRLKKGHDLFVLVVTLMAYGCPVQAVVAAFGLDERTVGEWLRRAGRHCQGVHERTVGQSQLDLEQVQADEIKVKTQAGSFWMALALMVGTRLWLAGVVGKRRDFDLIAALMAQVRALALCRPLLVAVDGFSTYVKAVRRAFRSPLHAGLIGRPHLFTWPQVAIVQVVKRRTEEALSIERRIVQGSTDLVSRLLARSQGGGGINTAYIERFNATFRQRLAWLGRRSRALARTPITLECGMYLSGCVYNFCSYHKSLRLSLLVGSHGRRHWVQRTPALAAGLTDHSWSVAELLWFKLSPPPYAAPKRRGRPPKQAQLAAP